MNQFSFRTAFFLMTIKHSKWRWHKQKILNKQAETTCKTFLIYWLRIFRRCYCHDPLNVRLNQNIAAIKLHIWAWEVTIPKVVFSTDTMCFILMRSANTKITTRSDIRLLGNVCAYHILPLKLNGQYAVEANFFLLDADEWICTLFPFYERTRLPDSNVSGCCKW